jgi:hypothetical protein
MKKRDAASDPSLAARGAPFSVEAKNSRHHLRTGATGEAGHHSAPTPDPLGRDRMPTSVIYSKDHSRPDQRDHRRVCSVPASSPLSKEAP